MKEILPVKFGFLKPRKINKKWIVLCGKEKAIFYLSEKNQLTSFHIIENTAFPSPTFLEDAPGRVFSSAYSNRRHSLAARQSQEDHASILFSNKIAEYIEVGAKEKRFDTLTLVAEPGMQGTLKAQLKAKTPKLKPIFIGKNLLKEPKESLANHLEKLLKN